MIFVKLDSEGNICQVHDDSEHEGPRHIWYNENLGGPERKFWEGRHEWQTFERATEVATQASALTGKLYLPIDNGSSTWPRYDIMEAPKVGDKVSYGFNGDYYPDGEIVKITKTFQIKTSTGNTYRRVRKNSARWAQPGGTWSLVQGHINERNPSF